MTAAAGLAQLVSKFDVPPLADQNKHSNTSWEWASSLYAASVCFSVLSEGRPALPSIDIDRAIERSGDRAIDSVLASPSFVLRMQNNCPPPMFVLFAAPFTTPFELFVTNLHAGSVLLAQTLSTHEIRVVLCLGSGEGSPVTAGMESRKQLAEVAKREGRDLPLFQNPHLFVQIFPSDAFINCLRLGILFRFF